MKRIAYSKDALRSLRRMPANTAANIREKIELYATIPGALANKVVRLQGMNGYLRLRVGGWRVIFTEDADVVAIIKVGARGSVYEKERGMNTQIITTPSGERMVILPEGEFQSLIEAVENAEDSAAVKAFEARLAAGEEELLPAELANAILGGANPIRAWREHRGMTIKSLAQSAGIAAAYLSQLETGQRDGTIETMKRLAAALKVTIDDLV